MKFVVVVVVVLFSLFFFPLVMRIYSVIQCFLLMKESLR